MSARAQTFLFFFFFKESSRRKINILQLEVIKIYVTVLFILHHKRTELEMDTGGKDVYAVKIRSFPVDRHVPGKQIRQPVGKWHDD